MGANDKLEATFHGNDRGPRRADETEDQARQRQIAAGISYGVVPEQETIGDWAGHTPTIDAEIEKGRQQLEEDRGRQSLIRQIITDGIGDLVTISGENSRDHGFHDDWPVDIDLISPETDRDFQKAITEKLTLMQEETIEAFGEIRSGNGPWKTYFVDKKGLIGAKGSEHQNQAYGCFVNGELAAYIFGAPKGDMTTPLLKPEGFLVEIADLFIRGADLVYLLGAKDAFTEALAIKHEYNATRPFKHGRQF